MRRDPIKVVPYDPDWPLVFERERLRLEAALAPWRVGPVEHMGSTAIPGLAAKPIIDMVVPVDDYSAVAAMATALRQVHWSHAPEPDDDQMRRGSFCHPDPVWRTHHLHAIEAGRDEWRQWLAFRDKLRAAPELAAEYQALKQELAGRHPGNRASYRAGKGAFVERVLRSPT